ncbi:unnamed protein product [Closterium sp. NIES-53]
MHRHAHCAGAKWTTCRRLYLRSPVDHVPPNRRSTLPIYLGDSRAPRRPRRPGNFINQATMSTRCVIPDPSIAQADDYHMSTTPGRPLPWSTNSRSTSIPVSRPHPVGFPWSASPKSAPSIGQPAEVGALPKSAPLQWPLCRSTRPVDQLAHCCRSAALLTPNPEVSSAQARTGPTTTPVDNSHPGSKVHAPNATSPPDSNPHAPKSSSPPSSKMYWPAASSPKASSPPPPSPPPTRLAPAPDPSPAAPVSAPILVPRPAPPRPALSLPPTPPP